MDLFDKIKRSLDYGALDHKWLARNYLDDRQRNQRKQQVQRTEQEQEQELYHMATSAFDYFMKYRDVLQSDPSIRSITELCSNEGHRINVQEDDDNVFHLSNVFNEIIESTRALHRCYDCGTNARAIFLKLIETHRGLSYITHEEQQRMKNEYQVKRRGVKDHIERCLQRIIAAESDTVFIMSLAIQSFGHVWVIEKRFFDGSPRYHHYQTSLRSHLLLDFIEWKDYGRDLNQSLDLEQFFGDLTYILTKRTKWTDQDYRIFAKLFAFIPVSEVTDPNGGFSYTWITY